MNSGNFNFQNNDAEKAAKKRSFRVDSGAFFRYFMDREKTAVLTVV